MKHEIKMNDFLDPALFRNVIASSCGQCGRRTLTVISDAVTLKVFFEVSDGATKTQCFTLENAIQLYNELP